MLTDLAIFRTVYYSDIISCDGEFVAAMCEFNKMFGFDLNYINNLFYYQMIISFNLYSY